jgi:hypothetical protein
MSTKLTSTTIILITISLFLDIMSTVVNVMFHKCYHYNDQLIRDLVKKSNANNCWQKCACARELWPT